MQQEMVRSGVMQEVGLYETMEYCSRGTDIKIRKDKSDGDSDCESNFAVLKGVKCPAVLTENLFQDNEDDVRLLLNPDIKKLIVQAHVLGICRFIGDMGWSNSKELKENLE